MADARPAEVRPAEVRSGGAGRVGAPLPASRTALITGASSGIGREVAVGLARAGFAVGLVGRDRTRLDETAQAAAASGGPVAVATADVTDYEGVQRAVDVIVDALGPVDLLVNNAGVIEPDEVPVWEADPETWRRILEVDLLGPFHLVRAVVPGMLASGVGRIVDLNSGAGARDAPVYSAYHAAKAGLFRLGGALHAAGADLGLRSFELAPGTIETPMTRSMAVHDGREDWTDPAEVVDLVVALAGGELDAFSGRMVRAGTDTPRSLRARLDAGPLTADARTLGVLPWGEDDPLRP